MNRKRWLVTAAAGLAAVVGGGAALATTGSNDPDSDFLGDVAKRLGISQDKLEGAIEGATVARIDAAVARGDLTKEQGEELKKRVRSGDGPVILPGFRGPKLGIGPLGIGPLGPPEKGFFPGPFPGFDFVEQAADYLGMESADVRKALRDGKSLADLAKQKGKSVDGLEQTLRDAIRNDADKAVDDGVLTKEQADHIAKKLSATADELVEHDGGPIFRFRGPRLGLGPLGPPGRGFFPGAFPGFDFLQSAADYLGMDAAEVRQALADGKSLADLAKQKGKSVDGLEQSLRAAIRKDADKAVDDGELTKKQADRIADKLGSGVDELVEGGEFEFKLRIRPKGMPPPDEHPHPAFDPA
jgi:lambda repressor-like predicted transcriptional regulator